MQLLPPTCTQDGVEGWGVQGLGSSQRSQGDTGGLTPELGAVTALTVCSQSLGSCPLHNKFLIAHESFGMFVARDWWLGFSLSACQWGQFPNCPEANYIPALPSEWNCKHEASSYCVALAHLCPAATEGTAPCLFLPTETKSTWCPFNLETKENKVKQMEAKLSHLEIWVFSPLNFWYLFNEPGLLLASEREQSKVTHAASLLLHNLYK